MCCRLGGSQVVLFLLVLNLANLVGVSSVLPLVGFVFSLSLVGLSLHRSVECLPLSHGRLVLGLLTSDCLFHGCWRM